VSGELWAVHVLGMDDLLPCASRRLAIRNATWLNMGLVPSLHRYDDELWPFVYNVPVVYPGSAAEHAEFLAREEAGDSRWSDPKSDVIFSLALELHQLVEEDDPDR
jgi:hypothetical protein